MADILIIDDQPHFKTMLSEDLSKEGHRIAWVADAGEAMQGLRASRPDIVLFELYLKGVENWELLHRIKLETPRIPILIMSAYTNFIGNPRLAEANGYVVKDICTGEIKKKIKEVMIDNALNHCPA
jgi:CheY-like chemotaxis protein